ncbi:hypothetical protein ACH5RR_025932 [Cinchona calisaya]|uniref:YDG domain-containing protein n=1 Tax=Cinchona calisaya TaxID=153742 RepID=A0ABD2Z120_9GENT
MDGTGKQLVEHGRHHSRRFQTNVNCTKVYGVSFECNGSEIPKGAGVENNVAESLRILPPNEARIEGTKPLVSSVKDAALKKKMTEKNVKRVRKEDKSKCVDAGKTTSQHTLFANGHPPSKLGKGVSVCKEFRRGFVGLHSKSGIIFIDGCSQAEPKSSIGMDKTHDEVIKDDIWGCSLTGRKVGKNASTENIVKDQNKQKQFIIDETCTVAQKKFTFDVRKAEAAREIEVAGSRVSKVNSREGVSPFPQSNNMWTVGSDKCPEVVSRNKVIKSVELFEEEYTKLLQDRKRERNERGKPTNRIDVKAAMILKEEGKWVNTVQEVGKIPGVEIGDQFQYRAELAVIGLHNQFSAGIDYIKVGEKLFATCIVDSGRYKNERRTPDEFIYTGEGGNPRMTKKKPEDQKLKHGNLALKTSMDAKLPVRVVHCCQSLKGPITLGINNGSGLRYTYDGLYTVNSYWKERDENGKLMFKFKMIRMFDKPNLVPRSLSETRKSTVEGMHGMIAGTSLPKEKKLIHSLNATTENKPPCCTTNSALDGGCSSRSSEDSHPKKASGPIRSKSEGGPIIKAKSIANQSGASGKRTSFLQD